MVNVHGCDDECGDIHFNFSSIQSVVTNHGSLTLKQMFDVTAQLVSNQEEISGLDKILYQKNSWTQLSLINDPLIINFKAQKSMSSQILCYVSAKFFNILNVMLSMESRLNSSGTSSQDSQRCSSVIKSVIF